MTSDDIPRKVRRNSVNLAFMTWLIPALQFAVDSIALIGTGYFCYYNLVIYSYKSFDFYQVAILFNWLAGTLIFQYAGLYQFDTILTPKRSVDRIIITLMTAFLLMFAAAFSLKISEVFSRIWIASLFFSSIAVVIAERFLSAWLIKRLAKSQIIARRVAIYGQPLQISRMLNFLKQSPNTFIGVVGVFFENTADSKNFDFPHLVRGDMQSLMNSVRSDELDDIVLALPWSESAKIKQISEALRELPTNILLGADLAGYEVRMERPPKYYESSPLFQLAGKPMSGPDIIIKTVMDIVIASMLIVLLSPLLLLTGILVKLTSPGPVLFRQRRLGFNNRIFDIYKFRSMTHHKNANETEKTVQAQVGDSRITPLGQFLRKTSVDELPQLFNVLNGTMSLVGPRPHAVDHNEDYSKQIRGYFARHKVRPGITGLAQIKGYRGLTDTVEKMENRVKYDIEYVETWSPVLDLKILALTPFAVVSGKNAV
jgi:putative colanic acid biosysnthesis UDP-glucose lipid carrier transferase